MEIPKGHTAVMPYLILNDATGFIGFTEHVFGASLKHKELRENTAIIMHAEIIINGSTIMFAQATEQFGEATGNLFVYVDNADDTYKKALSHGATTIMELSNQSYGRTCGVTDPCGNVWWVTSI